MKKEKIKNEYSSEKIDTTKHKNNDFVDACNSLFEFIVSFIDDEDIPLELRYEVSSLACSIIRRRNEKRKD